MFLTCILFELFILIYRSNYNRASSDTDNTSSDDDDGFSIETFKCIICLRTAKRPVVTRCCTKLVCYNCIQRWIRQNQTCPQCRKHLTMSDVIDVGRLVNDVSEVLIFFII